MQKFKQYFEQMLEDHKELFDKTSNLYDLYMTNNDKYREEFEEVRRQAYRVAKRYEDKLCEKTERGKYSSFSTGLGEKFFSEVMAHFPYISESVMETQL